MTLANGILALAAAVRDKFNANAPRLLPTAPAPGDVARWTGDDWVPDAALTQLAAEIAEARGDRSALALRLGTMSNFASPNAGGIVVGQYYDNAFQGTNSSTLAGGVNRVELAPWYTSQRMRVDRIGVAVSTAAAGVLGRCFVYGSGPDGWPDQLLWEAPSGPGELDMSVTGVVEHAVDMTFDAGRQYWLGLRRSGAAAVRAVNTGSAVNLGLSGANGTTYFTILRRTLDYFTPLPTTWGFSPADLAAGAAPPSIRMRAAPLT
jgi:hypothetical protein